jgi:hypothetical protein
MGACAVGGADNRCGVVFRARILRQARESVTPFSFQTLKGLSMCPALTSGLIRQLWNVLQAAALAPGMTAPCAA